MIYASIPFSTLFLPSVFFHKWIMSICSHESMSLCVSIAKINVRVWTSPFQQRSLAVNVVPSYLVSCLTVGISSVLISSWIRTAQKSLSKIYVFFSFFKKTKKNTAHTYIGTPSAAIKFHRRHSNSDCVSRPSGRYLISFIWIATAITCCVLYRVVHIYIYIISLQPFSTTKYY